MKNKYSKFCSRLLQLESVPLVAIILNNLGSVAYHNIRNATKLSVSEILGIFRHASSSEQFQNGLLSQKLTGKKDSYCTFFSIFKARAPL